MRLKKEFPQVAHLTIEKNRGFSGGANFGLEKAFALYPWVLFVTNDCEILELSELPAAPGLYAPLIQKRNTDRIDSIGAECVLTKGELRHRQKAETFSPYPFYAPGTAFLLHRDLFTSGLQFDEKLGTYWEDVDLSLRVHNAAVWKCEAFPSIRLKHAVGKTCHKHSLYTTYYFQRNRGIVSRRHTTGLRRLSFECHYAFDIVRRAWLFSRRAKWDQLRLLSKAYQDSWN